MWTSGSGNSGGGNDDEDSDNIRPFQGIRTFYMALLWLRSMLLLSPLLLLLLFFSVSLGSNQKLVRI